MKLIANRQIHGVKVLQRAATSLPRAEAPENKKVAFPGDVYEGTETHLARGIARKPKSDSDDMVDASSDGDSNGGDDEKAEVENLKARCAELGIEGKKWKNLRKPEKLLAVIDDFEKSQDDGDSNDGDGEGSGDDLGLGGDGE